MYTIQTDTRASRLSITFSGRMSTGEALRAISQAFVLAEASGIVNATCDIRQLQRAPANLVMIAAALSSRYEAGMRVAFVGELRQLGLVGRLVRYTGVLQGIHAFVEQAQADAWLELTRRRDPLLSSTGSRHVRDLVGPPTSGLAGAAKRRQGVS